MVAKRKQKKHISLIVCIGLLTFFLFACCPPVSEKTSDKKDKDAEKTKEKEEQTKTIKINEDIQVGEVRWKVLEASQPPNIRGKNPSGKWVIVHLEAELLGKETGTVSSSQLKIIDNQDREFESNSDGESQLSMEEKNTLVFEDVNPNVPIDGWAAFDIAQDSAGLKLRIEDLRTFSDEYGLIELGL